MKNIFIEGIQGTGKSTLLNNLSRKLPEYRVCRDGDYSPVDLAWCTWMDEQEYNQTLKQYEPIGADIIKNTVQEGDHYVVSYTRIITDIPNFHREMEKYEIYDGRKSMKDFEEIIFSRYRNFSETGYLFECSFFQNITKELMLFQQLSDDEIVEFYRRLYKEIDKKNFLLVYLYSDELEKQMGTIKKERCDNHGNEMWYPLMLQYLVHSPYGKQHGYKDFEDMIAHFKHRQQLELRIIREVIGEHAIILTAKGWKIQQIVEDIIKR